MSKLGCYGLILGLLCVVTPAAQAFGGRWHGSSYYGSASYYYPAYYPVYYAPSVRYSYHVPNVTYYVPTYQAVAAVPAATCAVPVQFVAPPVGTFATPFPAPPSGTVEPPISVPFKQPPSVKESTSQQPPDVKESTDQQPPKVKESTNKSYGSFYSGPPAGGPVTDTTMCKVGFWNLSNRPITVRVSGEVHVLQVSQSLALILPRQFDYQLDLEAPQTEIVPAGRASVDIVLR
jgi:hypothetical protein